MRNLLILLLILLGSGASAQYGCKDTLAADTYFQCSLYAGGDEYNPVCGCDNITYRNICAAEHWGGLYYPNWTDNTVCGNFHIDFRPTRVYYNPAQFQAYIRNPSTQNVSVAIYIYDVFGKLVYSWVDATSNDGFYPGPQQSMEIPANKLPYGLYILVAVVNGEAQTVKFAKLATE